MLGMGRYKRMRTDGQDATVESTKRTDSSTEKKCTSESTTSTTGKVETRPVEPEKKSEPAKKTESAPAKSPETEAEPVKKSEPKTTKKSETKTTEKSEPKPAEKPEPKSTDSSKGDSTTSKRKTDSSGVSRRSGEVVISSEAAEMLSRFFTNLSGMLGGNGGMTYENAITAVEERIKLAENRAKEAEARAKAAEEKLMEQSKPIGEKRIAEAGMTAEETEKFYANIDAASKAIDKAKKLLAVAEERKAARDCILGKHF